MQLLPCVVLHCSKALALVCCVGAGQSAVTSTEQQVLCHLDLHSPVLHDTTGGDWGSAGHMDRLVQLLGRQGGCPLAQSFQADGVFAVPMQAYQAMCCRAYQLHSIAVRNRCPCLDPTAGCAANRSPLLVVTSCAGRAHIARCGASCIADGSRVCRQGAVTIGGLGNCRGCSRALGACISTQQEVACAVSQQPGL